MCCTRTPGTSYFLSMTICSSVKRGRSSLVWLGDDPVNSPELGQTLRPNSSKGCASKGSGLGRFGTMDPAASPCLDLSIIPSLTTVLVPPPTGGALGPFYLLTGTLICGTPVLTVICLLCSSINLPLSGEGGHMTPTCGRRSSLPWALASTVRPGQDLGASEAAI